MDQGNQYADRKQIRNRDGNVSRGNVSHKLFAGPSSTKNVRNKQASYKVKQTLIPADRQIHSGLQDMQQRIKQLVGSTEPKIRAREMHSSPEDSPKKSLSRAVSRDRVSSKYSPSREYANRASGMKSTITKRSSEEKLKTSTIDYNDNTMA